MSECEGCCHHHHGGSVSQTLDELEFERGIWSAAQYGDFAKVFSLLDNGKCVNMRDSSGYTALHYAARNGHLKVCELLISRGAEVDAVTKSGRATPLHRAASAGKTEVLQLLLQKRADPLLKDSDGKTALHRAVINDNIEICRILLEAAPELKHLLDNKGKKAIDYSVSAPIIGILQ